MNWHLITGEYPPMLGGVADYTRQVAAGLADRGESVTVWCPSAGSQMNPGVTLRPIAGGFTASDLLSLGRELDLCPAPRRLLVQWVPHGFGCRGLNLRFAAWLLQRARKSGDEVWLTAHEAFLGFESWRPRRIAAASVQRLMATLAMARASRVFVSIPAWTALLKPYAPRQLRFDWTPVPNNIPVQLDPERTLGFRSSCRGRLVAGHFGTYSGAVAGNVARLLELMAAQPEPGFLLIGKGSREFRQRLSPALQSRTFATGALEPSELSPALAACDLLLQPYVDGISSRRGSAMAPLAHGLPFLSTRGRLTDPVWASSPVPLVPADDMPAMARQAHELLENPGRRLEIGAQGRDFYQKHFDLARTLDILTSLPENC